MPGSVYKALIEVSSGNCGFVTQDDAHMIGISAQRLVVVHHRGLLERRRQGLYRVVAMPAV